MGVGRLRRRYAHRRRRTEVHGQHRLGATPQATAPRNGTDAATLRAAWSSSQADLRRAAPARSGPRRAGPQRCGVPRPSGRGLLGADGLAGVASPGTDLQKVIQAQEQLRLDVAARRQHWQSSVMAGVLQRVCKLERCNLASRLLSLQVALALQSRLIEPDLTISDH